MSRDITFDNRPSGIESLTSNEPFGVGVIRGGKGGARRLVEELDGTTMWSPVE